MRLHGMMYAKGNVDKFDGTLSKSSRIVQLLEPGIALAAGRLVDPHHHRNPLGDA